jgi:hypothetical protein
MAEPPAGSAQSLVTRVHVSSAWAQEVELS